ncbi:tyrosine-type recombinase/integrase [Humidesulfovibrio idahonensis]
MAARIKTDYTGVYYYVQPRVGGTGTEKVFYAVFKRDGKVYEEPAGRQFRDNMTAAKAARIRASLIEGNRELAQVRRERVKQEKEAVENRPTIFRLWTLYKEARPSIKGLVTDENRFKLHIGPSFANKTPLEIDPLSIDRFRVRLGKQLTPKTTANVLELLRRIINFGVNRGLCESKIKIRLPKVDNLQTEDLSPEQLTRLLEALDTAENQAVARIMRMALFTGMRRGEILKLRWEDLDFERGFIGIRDPKGGQSAKIPMSPQARDMLFSLPRESDFVFPGRDDKQRVEVRRAARKICDTAGLSRDFRPMHGLRHAYASMLASSGQVDLYTLQRLLTHKSAAMTARYAHLRDEVLQRGASVAGQIMEDAQSEQKPKVLKISLAK